MLSPNKQNLILLKQQSKLTKNGYKLLQEKRNGLIINFLKISREGKHAEHQLLRKLEGFTSRFESVTAFVSSNELLEVLTKKAAMSLTIDKKRLSGVYVNQFDLVVQPPIREPLKESLHNVLHQFGPLFKEIVELSQMKSNVENLAQEIHKTNRQISNLEQKIESIAANIKYIKSALMEKENYEKSVLMKIFS